MTRNHPDFLIAKIGLLYETAKLFPNFFFYEWAFFIGISHYLINKPPTSHFRTYSQRSSATDGACCQPLLQELHSHQAPPRLQMDRSHHSDSCTGKPHQ